MNNKSIINENINLRSENKRLKQQVKDLKESNAEHRVDKNILNQLYDNAKECVQNKETKIDSLIDLLDTYKKEYLSKLKENKNKYLSELVQLNNALNDYKERYLEVHYILNSKDREDLRIQKFKKLVKDICNSNNNLLYDLKRPIWIEPKTRELRSWEDISRDAYIGTKTITMREFSIFDLIEERL